MAAKRSLLAVGIALAAAMLGPAAQGQPQVIDLIGNQRITVNSVIKLAGSELKSIEQVYVDGIRTTFIALSDEQLAVRIPRAAKPGDAEVLLLSDTGNQKAVFRIEILAPETAFGTKVTIGTFLGYVAVYTKNLAGHKLSIQVGNKLREVSQLDKNFTSNLTKIGSQKVIEVNIFVDDQLVKTTLIRTQ